MPDLVYLLAVLACPIAMGVMMLVMMRSGDHRQPPSAGSDGGEVAQLRAEVERLREAQELAADAPRPSAPQSAEDSRSSSAP